MAGVSTAAAVVALKQSPYAKSRLDLPAPLRRRLAWTMALDTLTALSRAVTQTLVVSDQPALQARLTRAGVDAVVQPEPPGGGLNAALADGSAELRRRGHRVVLACVGDLPALRTESVERIVATATGLGRSFLADASGVGTTMLVADEVDLSPMFHGRSAAAHHHSGAVSLTAERLGAPLADARRDVDTEVDLEIAWSLGLGPHTAALVDPAGRLGPVRRDHGDRLAGRARRAAGPHRGRAPDPAERRGSGRRSSTGPCRATAARRPRRRPGPQRLAVIMIAGEQDQRLAVAFAAVLLVAALVAGALLATLAGDAFLAAVRGTFLAPET